MAAAGQRPVKRLRDAVHVPLHPPFHGVLNPASVVLHPEVLALTRSGRKAVENMQRAQGHDFRCKAAEKSVAAGSNDNERLHRGYVASRVGGMSRSFSRRKERGVLQYVLLRSTPHHIPRLSAREIFVLRVFLVQSAQVSGIGRVRLGAHVVQA